MGWKGGGVGTVFVERTIFSSRLPYFLLIKPQCYEFENEIELLIGNFMCSRHQCDKITKGYIYGFDRTVFRKYFSKIKL